MEVKAVKMNAQISDAKPRLVFKLLLMKSFLLARPE